MEKKAETLEKEEATLEKEQEDLEVAVNKVKTENSIKQRKNAKMEALNDKMRHKVEAMEQNIEKTVMGNMADVDHYQEVVKSNKVQTEKMIEDLRNVNKQQFEMGNINECMEQRIDQVKAQKELSIILSKAGLERALEAETLEAKKLAKRIMPDLQHHTELSWEEKLVERLKELDDARREASDTSINDQVQGNMQQIRDKNKQIVILTQ